MAFVLKQSDTYSWPVTFEVPTDGGRHERQTFDGEFKRLPQSRIRELGKLIETNEITDVEVASEVMVGWKGITDDNGKELPFSQKALEQLMEVPLLATQVVAAYFTSLAGAKRKN